MAHPISFHFLDTQENIFPNFFIAVLGSNADSSQYGSNGSNESLRHGHEDINKPPIFLSLTGQPESDYQFKLKDCALVIFGLPEPVKIIQHIW